MNKNYLFLIINLLVIVGFASILFYFCDFESSKHDWNSVVPDMSHYWTCMDGCYYMQEIILGELSYGNKTQEKYHSDCSEVCWEQLIEKCVGSNEIMKG